MYFTGEGSWFPLFWIRALGSYCCSSGFHLKTKSFEFNLKSSSSLQTTLSLWTNFSSDRINLKVNVDPFSSSDSKVMLPLYCFTIWSAIMSPRPIPFVFMCSESLTKPKSLNSFPWSFLSMPMPESMTDIYKNLLPSCSKISTLILTNPFCVNLRAFD